MAMERKRERETHTRSEQHFELLKWNVSRMQIKTGHLVKKDKIAALSSECWTETHRSNGLKCGSFVENQLVENANG